MIANINEDSNFSGHSQKKNKKPARLSLFSGLIEYNKDNIMCYN